MEGDDDSLQKLSDGAAEHFNCSICLELVYKPVVQACGHMFCFWCTFQAMDSEKQSQCPVCRQPYIHFPRVCKLLHLFLTKAAPEEYKRRECEILAKEEKEQIYSPCFQELQEIPQVCQELTGGDFERGAAGTSDAVMALNANALVGINDHHNTLESSHSKAFNCEERECDCTQRNTTITQSVLSVDDFQCLVCNDLLYRPVVLNCGDVFCKTCLQKLKPELLECPSCRAPHPGGSVCVCIELHQYLESSFPVEYSRKHVQTLEENSLPIDYKMANVEDCMIEDLHEGVGCDGCGMCPIIGDRYQCDECTEIIGFDLCGSCYNSGGSMSGRFNQKHQSNHRMKRILLPSFTSHATGLNIY